MADKTSHFKHVAANKNFKGDNSIPPTKRQRGGQSEVQNNEANVGSATTNNGTPLKLKQILHKVKTSIDEINEARKTLNAATFEMFNIMDSVMGIVSDLNRRESFIAAEELKKLEEKNN